MNKNFRTNGRLWPHSLKPCYPRSIGVNFSEDYGIADGITKTDYEGVMKTLPGKYKERIVSAEQIPEWNKDIRIMLEETFFLSFRYVNERQENLIFLDY